MAKTPSKIEEFFLGGIAAAGAGLFTNPLEVIKTRMQLQGELKAKGHYSVHYRNVLHAFYTVARQDGFTAIQKGLVPALWYQFFMNGVRLGAYQIFTNRGLTKDHNGNVSVPRSIAIGAASGVLGAFVGSPFYMVKTQLQARSVAAIAVGHQHTHSSMLSAFQRVFSAHGVFGLWRGVSASMCRVMVGSASQLTTFTATKEYLENMKVFPKESWMTALTAAMISGVVVTAAMTPFDVISTRLYNQGLDASGRGLFYKGFLDCFVKIFMKEGIWGFYKGWAASYFRLGPHSILSLSFWNEARKRYMKHKAKFADTENTR